MLWIDFGVICIGQDRISTPPDMNDIIVEGYQRTEDSEPIYNEYYNFHTLDNLLGCWYNIWLPEPICYEESIFDITSKGMPYVKVVPKWSDYVKTILSFYINESPCNKIAVLLRIEDKSNNVVHFDCSLFEFIQAISEGNIKWNELYFIH